MFPSLPHWMCFPAIGIGSGVLGFRPYCVHRPSLRLPYLMFSIRSFCHRISFVFLLYGRRIVIHSVSPSLTYFLGQFPGLELALIPAVVIPVADHRYTHEAENANQISARAGVEPRTFVSNARACKMLSTCVFAFSRLQCECL